MRSPGTAEDDPESPCAAHRFGPEAEVAPSGRAGGEVALGGPGRLRSRRGPLPTEQPHLNLLRLLRLPVPYFWCTACLYTPSSAAICCQLQPSSRARRTCSSSTDSSSARSD